MHSAPDIIQRAASFDWEALLPVAFFLLYGISQLLGQKKKTEEQEDGPKADATDRAKQIREEIRRKIEQRKQAASGRKPSPGYDPMVPDGQQTKLRPQQSELRPEQSSLDQPARRIREEPVQRPQWQMPEQTVSIEERLNEQRQLLEETRQKAKEARERAAQIATGGRKEQMRLIKQRSDVAETGPRTKKSFRENLLIGLRQPESIRRAILYQEILEKPVGLR